MCWHMWFCTREVFPGIAATRRPDSSDASSGDSAVGGGEQRREPLAFGPG